MKKTRKVKCAPESPGSLCRDARIACAMSQHEAGKLAGLGQGYISRFEAGHYDASVSTLRRLANAYGVRVSNLIPADW